MQLSPHLTFRGDCEAAFRFYAQCLGGRIVTMLRYGDSPAAAEVPAEWRDRIVHASLAVGDGVLAGADVLPGQYERPQGFFVMLGVAGRGDAERIFRALSEGGVVRMAMQKTFWSEAFGVVVDRFGTPWEISCEGPVAHSRPQKSAP